MDLATEHGASGHLGAVFFAALVAELHARAPGRVGAVIYDCGNRPGDALAALAAGLKDLRVDAEAATPALLSLAAEHGAHVRVRGELTNR